MPSYPPSITVTGATPTLLATFVPPKAPNDVTVAALRISVSGRATDGSAALFIFEACFKSSAGAATLVGSVVTLFAEQDQAWSVSLAAGGAGVQVTVTGDSSRTVTWAVCSDLRLDVVYPLAQSQPGWSVTYQGA